MSSLRIALVIDAENPVVNDLFLQTGTARLTANLAEETAQSIWTDLHFFKGEWFLDTAAGMPYFQLILGQKTPLSIVSQIFRQAILRNPGVASITRWVNSLDSDRTFRLDFQALLKDGTVLTQKDFAPFIIKGV